MKVSGCSLSAIASRSMRSQRRLGDGAPAEAGDHGVAVQLQAGQRQPHVGRDDAAQADREALLQHDHALGALQRGAHRGQRERAERVDAEHADLHAVGAQLVDVSFSVPITEPSATTMVSASSQR